MADRMAVQLEETGANGLSREEALVDLRTTLDWLGGDVQYIEAEIDQRLFPLFDWTPDQVRGDGLGFAGF